MANREKIFFKKIQKVGAEDRDQRRKSFIFFFNQKPLLGGRSPFKGL